MKDVRLNSLEELLRKVKDLEHRLATDALTGAKSRDFFLEKFGDYASRNGAMLFLDIDNFKSVNDHYGHSVGDALLRQIALVVGDEITDIGFVARLGGDEFVVLFDVNKSGDVESVSSRVLSAVSSASVQHGELEVSRNASIGCLRLNPEMDAHEAIDVGDHASRNSKNLGKNRATKFDPSSLSKVKTSPSVDELILGLHRREIGYHVQPILSCSDERIWAFEALLRWTKPDGQVLSPASFLNTMTSAYSGGAKPPLTAARQVAEWATIQQGKLISFNISPAFLERVSLDNMSWVNEIVGESPNHAIIFEITEATASSELDSISRSVAALRERGIKVALDDFGVGASNLERLTSMPIDIVKLDRLFLRQAVNSPRSMSMFLSTVDLCKNANALVVVEGVEQQRDLEVAISAGADFVQGFHLGVPAPVSKVTGIE